MALGTCDLGRCFNTFQRVFWREPSQENVFRPKGHKQDPIHFREAAFSMISDQNLKNCPFFIFLRKL